MTKSVGNLSLSEKVGQMFLIGLDGYTADESIMELIQKYKVGGFVIYENNVQSAEQLLRLINTLKTMNVGNDLPLFIAVSQEGGRVNVLPSEVRRLPAIKYVSEDADKSLVHDVGSLTARTLKAFGINMNFCPVLDLGGAVEGKNMGDRCISSNPTIVASYGGQVVAGHNSEGVIAIPKYFPGHGTTQNKGTDIVIPYTNKSIQKLEQTDLIPFKSAIDAGIDALMVGHINLARLNLFAPATMSHKVISKLLKDRYSYKGIVVADDLTNVAVDIQYGIKASARKAIMAGCDIMIIRDPKKVKIVLEDITKQIKNGNIYSQEIDSRVQKILDLKDKFNVNDQEISKVDIDSLNKEIDAMIEKVRK